MDILTLGPVKAHLNGQDCVIGSAKQRALLARLVVKAGRPVTPIQLCEDLWAEQLPRDPLHALQARISRLRSALPTLGINLTDGGYYLDPASFRTDTALFEKLIEQGGWLLANGGLVQSYEHLQQALGLWRGPAFAGVPELPVFQAEAARLETMRTSVLADRIDIDLALGRETAVIPELTGLIEADPLFERHWAQLMIALYRAGRSQEALDVYSRARTATAELLGTEPSTDLRRLHLQMLRSEPSETLLRLPAATPVLTPHPGTKTSGLGTDSKLTSNRADLLAALVCQHRAVVVTGPAGVGKTHLLKAVRTQFEAEHCLASLLSASTLSQSVPLGVFAGTASSLANEPQTPAALIDSYVRHRSTAVLLIDNVELLDDSSLFVVTQLIKASRVPAVLVTRSLTDAPAEIQALYDSGELSEISVESLSDVEATHMSTSVAGGALTPDSRLRILEVAGGNPRQLREIITGSVADGRLVQTAHGWQLYGEPAPSPRLAQLVGARFDDLAGPDLEALIRVAIAGEYPRTGLEPDQRRALARTQLLGLSDHGWLRLARPIDREVLRARCSEVLWNELTREVVQVLKSDAAAGVPEARRRADILALDLDDPVDITATLELAERALGAFDERLALRATEAVIAQDPNNSDAHRLAAVASSALGLVDLAHTHFDLAASYARSERELASVALAHARHRGLRLHSAPGALDIIVAALGKITDTEQMEHLQRAQLRWAAIAGMSTANVPVPDLPADAAGVLGLIVVGTSGVITGPLHETQRVLKQIRQVPAQILSLIPGGASLVTLTEIMAISNSGDVLTTQRLLREQIGQAGRSSPESLGQWEYALGFSELLSGDAAVAYGLARSAVGHLQWRDPAGLLPAAQALGAACASATGRAGEARVNFDAIPQTAAQDPKVVMLRAWATAGTLRAQGKGDDAARELLETARWLLAAQHTYFAGMVAHCVVRMNRNLEEAAAVLAEAKTIAGGGLLDLFARHGQATLKNDQLALDQIAHEARELGMLATAADTWKCLTTSVDDNANLDRVQRQRTALEQLFKEQPMLVSWVD